MLSVIKSLECHNLFDNPDMVVYKDKLITNLFDNTVGIWNLNSGDAKPIKTLKDYSFPVGNMVIYKEKLITAFYDNTIKIFDLNSQGKGENIKSIKTLEGHK